MSHKQINTLTVEATFIALIFGTNSITFVIG